MAVRPTEIPSLCYEGVLAAAGGSWTAPKAFDALLYSSIQLAFHSDVPGLQIGTQQGGTAAHVDDIAWVSEALPDGGYGITRDLPGRFVKTMLYNPGAVEANVRLYVVLSDSPPQNITVDNSDGLPVKCSTFDDLRTLAKVADADGLPIAGLDIAEEGAPATRRALFVDQAPADARLFDGVAGDTSPVYSDALLVGSRGVAFVQGSNSDADDDTTITFQESVDGTTWTAVSGASLVLVAAAPPVAAHFQVFGKYLRAVIPADPVGIPVVTLAAVAK